MTMRMESGERGREVLTPEQLADFLGCGRTYAFELLKNGAIPSFKLGRLRRVRRADAVRYVESLAGGDSAN